MSRKDEILDAALNCFTEFGIENTSIEMICKDSGASVGSLYHHFKNKQGVVAALFVKGIHSYHIDLAKRLKTSDSAEAGIHNIIIAFLTWVKANPEWARFVLYSRGKIYEPSALDMVAAENQSNTALFEGWLTPHMTSGIIKPMPMEIFLSLVLGPAQQYTRGWVSGRSKQKNILKYKQLFAEAAWLSVKAS